MSRAPRLSGRVTIIKWLAIGQLIMAVLLFGLAVTFFGLDFSSVKVVDSVKVWSFPGVLLLNLLIVATGLMAGVSGAAMNRYEGVIHNISLKNQTLSASTAHAFAAMFYLIFAGTQMFYNIDKDKAFNGKNSASYKADYAIFIVIFILSFFDMILAFATVVAACLWTPREPTLPFGQAPEVIQEEPAPVAYVREERIRPSEYYSRDRKYGANAYYGPQYRTLPALKYY